MSTLLHTRQRITELLGILAWQAKASSASGHTDFNKVSEDVLVPLFKLIFNLPDLKNLNTEKKRNFPAIDLADDKGGVAFQITATFESQKIKKSLETFVRKNLYKQYPRLIFYIITEKKDSYPKKAFADIVQGKFEFNVDDDIIDFRDLTRLCNQLQLDKASKVKRILEANCGRGDYSVFSEKQAVPFEEVHLNLIEVSFPDKLYVANLLINREEIIENARGALKRNDPTRTIIRHYIIEQLKLDFFSGWHIHEKQLITFHNLDDETFLRKIIDEGSIESIKPEKYYAPNGKLDEDKERVFKTLLRKTLQEQLYRQDVEWQYKEGLFIFIENGTEKETKEAQATPIKRHLKIRGEANPYDPQWEVYFEERLGLQMVNTPQGYRRLVHLWFGQEGSCAVCAQKITRQSGWTTGRLVRRTSEHNRKADLVLLHPTCHRRVRPPTVSSHRVPQQGAF